MSAGISIREFARRDGCDDKLVRRAIKQGRLTPLDDGTLDPTLVGTGWRRTNRLSADNARTDGEVAARAKAALEMVTAPGVELLSQAAAERLKENYLALLRQLEYDQKSGAVVPVEEVSKAVGEEYARVRTRLLAIPAEQAPRLHRLKTAAEVQDALREIITEVLEELSGDGDGGEDD